ncbi:hypothetical protein HKD37_20G056086 [Glycine soja]
MSISCFLIKVDPWVLVPITFRGLYVLTIRGLHILAYRGLHALAFRGLRVLIFSVLHIHTLGEYKDRAHKTPNGPEEVQQGPGVSSSGIAPARHPVDSKKSNRVLQLSSSNYGSLSVLWSTCHLQQGHQALY